MAIGRDNASIPTKCIAQMPIPIAKPPPRSQANAGQPDVERMRNASVRAVYEARIATATETKIRPWW
jgi:hypothetical protein